MTKEKQEEETVTGLYGKIVAVMSEVESVAKNGYNAFNAYAYSTEADILAGIRGSLIKHKLVILPAVRSTTITTVNVEKGEQQLTTLDMEYTIVDAETGESITRGWTGQGQDKGDKGAYKAMTGAQKYFLLKTFLIATDDDPEKDTRSAAGAGGHVGNTPAQPAKSADAQLAEDANDILLTCETCGKPAVEKSGTSQSGKPWRGIMCSTGERSHVKWLAA